MSEYTPDRWVVLKMPYPSETIHKVFSGWYGGYLDGDSWRLNSGIKNVTNDKNGTLHFYGYSGNVVIVHPSTYGLSGYMAQVLASFEQQLEGIELLPEDTDWLALHE